MIGSNDLDWLILNYPGVNFIKTKEIFQGCLWFQMSYSSSRSEGVINPNDEVYLEDGLFIEDAFEIKFKINESQEKITAWETNGRILHTKNKWKLSYADVHMYEDGSLCLCTEPEEKLLFADGFRLPRFFYKILIPYFYYQSYLDKFGREPWKSSSHGSLGILESYDRQLNDDQPLELVVNYFLDSLELSLKNIILANKSLNISCLCGSGKKIKICHKVAFSGLKKLHRDYLIVKGSKFKNTNK